MRRLIVLIVFLLPLTAVAQFVDGLEGTSGSGLGPGRALYVTENNVVDGGWVTRIDTRTGAESFYAGGLPISWLQAFGAGFGGAVDVEFIDDTAYVLVTAVGAPFGGFVDGIYRIDGPGSSTVIADIGAWATANPPSGFFFVLSNGIQYAMQKYKDGFLVTDGHHNRILYVKLDGSISEFFAFGSDVVPSGLEVWGNRILMAAAGPVPHTPDTGKVYSLNRKATSASVIAGGEPLIVDVERGRGDDLYALSQGIWVYPPGCEGVEPPPCAGAPATPGTGALLEVDDNGFETIIGNVNLPTSLEIVRDTAFIVTLAGEVFKFEDLSDLDDDSDSDSDSD